MHKYSGYDLDPDGRLIHSSIGKDAGEGFQRHSQKRSPSPLISALGSGLLTGKYFSGATGRLSTDKRYAARYGQKWMLEAARALSELAAELGIDAATLSVAWAAHNAVVTAPIISARNVEQLKPSLDTKDLMLSTAVYARMEALSPRPSPETDRLEEASS